MSDKFQPLTMAQLGRWVSAELDARGSIFGLPRELFFVPRPDDAFRREVYGQPLDTPFGVAAGPHSQMAQNIIVAWLCGARFIELKTVQTLDELEVSKPCIDMQDEGYNVEWSQELKVHQSFDEYLRAWVLIHALHRKLGFPGERPGVVFNMSVGYDLAGIKQDNVQWFLRKMSDAGELLDRQVELVAPHLPEVRDIQVPARISDTMTLSTMHGCPPGEIGQISRYLMEEWGLHTSVKLNPTLLGPKRVRHIVNDVLGFCDVEVPDIAFEHDLKYPDAADLLAELQGVAKRCGVAFGVKLCNTLEVVNHRTVFAPDQKMMYLSGRPHHALAVNLAHELWEDFDGELLMSFAGGADALNVVALLAAGMTTVTSCSDLLRPGGYTRLLQYVERTSAAMSAVGALDIGALIREHARPFVTPEGAASTLGELAGLNLARYADAVLADPRYRKESCDRARTKTTRPLGPFDCIQAPCTDECPVSQRVPLYMESALADDLEAAVALTRDDNPMAAVLGRACTHLCEQTCTRAHYDEPLAIREMKRFVMAHEGEPGSRAVATTRREGPKVAVIGGGPCGLSAAWSLARAGYPVEVFEAQPYSGGMVSGSIPAYRATQEVIDQDLKWIKNVGVEVRHGLRVGRDLSLEEIRERGFRYVVLAAGAQQGLALGIPGEDAEGVLDGLDFLRAAREGRAPAVGLRVGVIGGGDVAMDCARTARRLSEGDVTIIYRRTMAQMPAHREELEEVLAEGIAVRELLAPAAIVAAQGRLAALNCARMSLGEPDASGRCRPVATGETEEVPLDTLIVAIGQQVDLEVLGGLEVQRTRRGWLEVGRDLETSIEGVFAGGDLVAPGPQTIVKALGDGKRIAAEIRRREEGHTAETAAVRSEVDVVALLRQRSRLEPRVPVPRRQAEAGSFEEVLGTYSEAEARAEASRCLRCDLLCSVCASVCPNRAFFTYETDPLALPGLSLTVSQRFQTAVLTDFCNECGNCATFCPTAGRPYQDKPRLYLSRPEFETQHDNAYLISGTDGSLHIEARSGGATHVLQQGERLRYTGPTGTLQLDPLTFQVLDGPMDGDLGAVAVMWALLRGIGESMGHLPIER